MPPDPRVNGDVSKSFDLRGMKHPRCAGTAHPHRLGRFGGSVRKVSRPLPGGTIDSVPGLAAYRPLLVKLC